MKVFTPLIGRFGNKLFQYCHARRYCELHGHTLCTPPWEGERIFEIPEATRTDAPDITLGGYGQNQDSLIYSRKWALDTLRLRADVRDKLDWNLGAIVAHVRQGDFADLGYPVIAPQSYLNAAHRFGYDGSSMQTVSEAAPAARPGITGDLAFLPDFYRMMHADVLFRANSSFSWWAATLGEARVFSPVIDGKPGGEVECEFVEGNYPKLSTLPAITDLHMFHENDRYDYPLTKDSLVIDVGGYEGRFAETINQRFNCRVVLFEPCQQFLVNIDKRLGGNSAIDIHPFSVGRLNGPKIIHVKGDSTGEFADGPTITTRTVAADVLPDSDLLKLNCEGGEFDILEKLLDTNTAQRHRNIQVQFHPVAPDAAKRYANIRSRLLATHRLTFDEPWCWQNFERR